MIQEKLNFEDHGLSFDPDLKKKKKKKPKVKVGDHCQGETEEFLKPITCEVLKLNSCSAIVGITKTFCKADFSKSMELHGKTVVSFDRLQRSDVT